MKADLDEADGSEVDPEYKPPINLDDSEDDDSNISDDEIQDLAKDASEHGLIKAAPLPLGEDLVESLKIGGKSKKITNWAPTIQMQLVFG